MKKRGPYTIQDIDAKLLRAVMKGEEVWCPTCCQRLSVKPHLVTANMVNFLWRLEARDIAFGGGWYKTTDVVALVKHQHQKVSTDGPAARHFGLILASGGSVNKAGAPVGSYQITARGKEFLHGKLAVPAKAFVINGEIWTTGQNTVFVNQVDGVAFDYVRDVLGLAKELKKIARNREIND